MCLAKQYHSQKLTECRKVRSHSPSYVKETVKKCKVKSFTLWFSSCAFCVLFEMYRGWSGRFVKTWTKATAPLFLQSLLFLNSTHPFHRAPHLSVREEREADNIETTCHDALLFGSHFLSLFVLQNHWSDSRQLKVYTFKCIQLAVGSGGLWSHSKVKHNGSRLMSHRISGLQHSTW